MIRLIVSDLDGTLLDQDSQVPDGFFEMVDALYRKGVRFCAASGRQVWSLEQKFEPVKDKMLFAADNGARVMDGGKQLLIDPVPTTRLPELVQTVRRMDGVHAMICCAHGAYYDEGDSVYDELKAEAQEHVFAEPDLLTRTSDTAICKISIYDEHGAEGNSYPLLTAMLPELQVVLSGRHYCDVMKRGVNKGTAVKALQKYLGIPPEECMAFGDYLNDIPMMAACGLSYAVQNAHPALKEAARHEAPANTENGVMQTILKAIAGL